MIRRTIFPDPLLFFQDKTFMLGFPETNNNIGRYVGLNQNYSSLDLLKIMLEFPPNGDILFNIMDIKYNLQQMMSTNLNTTIRLRGNATEEKRLKPILIQQLRKLFELYGNQLNELNKIKNLLNRYNVQLVLYSLNNIPGREGYNDSQNDFYIVISSKQVFKREDQYKIPLHLLLSFLQQNDTEITTLRDLISHIKRFIRK